MAMPEVGNLTDVSYAEPDATLLDMTSIPDDRVMAGDTDITEFIDEAKLQQQVSDIYKQTSDTWQGVIDTHQTLKDKFPDFYKEWQAKQMGVTGIGSQPLSGIVGMGTQPVTTSQLRNQALNQGTIPNWMKAMQGAGTK